MTYDELMKTLKICSVGNATDCNACPLDRSSDCHTIMARAALDALNTKAEPLDQRQMALKTVEMALDKGGYSVTATPDGEVRMMPWGETARWIKDAKDNIWHCSACGYHFGWKCMTFKFCPNCGAGMEDDNEDG